MEEDFIDTEFQAAADHVQIQVTSAPKASAFHARENQLALYGLYKQSMLGKCNVKKPGMFDLGGRAKWDAWAKLGEMDPADAKVKYVDTVKSIDSNWQHSSQRAAGGEGECLEDGPSKTETAKKSSAGMGPVFSAFAYDDEDDEGAASSSLPEGAMHEPAARGDVLTVAKMLGAGSWPLDLRDDQGATALHFAADRGHGEIVELLVKAGTSTEVKDDDGLTPLHYAAMCEHLEVCQLLLQLGADPSAQDSSGQTPRQLGPSSWSIWSNAKISITT